MCIIRVRWTRKGPSSLTLEGPLASVLSRLTRLEEDRAEQGPPGQPQRLRVGSQLV